MTFGGRSPLHQPVARTIRVRQQVPLPSFAVSGGSDFVAFTQTFAYNGTDGTDGSVQTLTIPTGVTKLLVEGLGASGTCNTFSPTGTGGLLIASFDVEEGETFDVYVGGCPRGLATGGYNGGGTGTAADTGGGGATDIRATGGGLSTRLFVAGGGGGKEGGCNRNGGGGGYPNGQSGDDPGGGSGPTGGTPTAGGNGDAPGVAGTFGVGGTAGGSFGGGGGGGWWGGGGGGNSTNPSCGTSGGGGSGLIHASRGIAYSMSFESAIETHGSLTVTSIPG